jgi:Tol biopolymer transport system component
MASAVMTALALLAFRTVYFRQKPLSAPEMRVDIATTPSSRPTSFALSPDGTSIAYVASDQGHSKLWHRLLNSTLATPLPGSDFAAYPFWSPDGRSIAFFSEGKLKRQDVEGGALQVLADAPIPRGGTWNQKDTIVFAPTAAGPLYQVPARGGKAEPFTQLNPGEHSHRFPLSVGDGRILFRSSATTDGTYIIEADGSRHPFMDPYVVGTIPGQLLFIRQGKLLAARFAPGQGSLGTGESLIATDIASDGFQHWGVAASNAGLIAYHSGDSRERRQLVWFDRSGHEIGRITGVDTATTPTSPEGSPDGSRVVFHGTVPGQGTDVWFVELARNVVGRITTNPATDVFPIWSPDGRRVAFASNRNGVFDLFQTPASGGAKDETLLLSQTDKTPRDWSPDGKFLLYEVLDPENTPDIWVLPMTGERKEFPLVQSRFVEQCPQFSPDGNWVAYQSNLSGRFEIYLQRFPHDEQKIQVSTTGGTQVRWNRNGRELFYIATDGALVSTMLKGGGKNSDFEVLRTTRLFSTRTGDTVVGQDGPQYLVSADGQRFLVDTIVEEPTSTITLLVNWKPKAGN